eukprot:772652-Amphidinium_carterae.1
MDLQAWSMVELSVGAQLPQSSGGKLTQGSTKIPKWASGWCIGAWVGKTRATTCTSWLLAME